MVKTLQNVMRDKNLCEMIGLMPTKMLGVLLKEDKMGENRFK